MDNIYLRVRNRTNDGLTKVENMLKEQAEEYFYEKSYDLYSVV
jgi:hypothetical protein